MSVGTARVRQGFEYMDPIRTAQHVATPASFPLAAGTSGTLRSVRQPHHSAPLMRKYAAASLSEDGRHVVVERLAPASSDFECAFSAFTHSTQLYAPGGPIQASDLVPGDLVTTANGETRQVTWVGSMTGMPMFSNPELPQFRLIRISADSFGLDRPMGDLTLSPHALLDLGGERISAADRVDGEAFYQILPRSSVRMFQVMLDKPACLLANGLPVASYVPTGRTCSSMGPNRLALFRSFFAHTALSFADI